MIEVKNVVVKIDFKQPIKIGSLYELLGAGYEVSYKPAVFPGVVVKFPRGAMLLFKTGKGICVGCKKVEEAVEAVEKLHRMLVDKGIVKDGGFEISVENVVATGDMGHPIDVEKVAEKFESTIYEPGIFPAVIYYQKVPKATMLLFPNGKVIIAGVRYESEAEDAFRQVKSAIKQITLEAEAE